MVSHWLRWWDGFQQRLPGAIIGVDVHLGKVHLPEDGRGSSDETGAITWMDQ